MSDTPDGHAFLSPAVPARNQTGGHWRAADGYDAVPDVTYAAYYGQAQDQTWPISAATQDGSHEESVGQPPQHGNANSSIKIEESLDDPTDSSSTAVHQGSAGTLRYDRRRSARICPSIVS